MTHRTKDTAGLYRTGRDDAERQLRFDRGTLLLEGVAELPAGLDAWFCYDPRVDAYRAPANCYSDIIGPLKGELARNKAPRYQLRELTCALEMTPYPHQREALSAWQSGERTRGGGIADRRRQNSGRATGVVLGATGWVDHGADAGPDAAVVRAVAGGLPGSTRSA